MHISSLHPLSAKLSLPFDQVEFQRAHLKEFGQFSLNFEVVYTVQSPDYVKYLDTQQAINFRILETFEKERIDLAYPTQTIVLNEKRNS
jgi:MscS family membrane protein